MPSTSISRRRLLAVSGGGLSAALAGCGALPWTDDEPTFTPADADAVLTDATPEIEWPVPVVPTSDALEAELERVDTLLADVPNPIERHVVSDGTARRMIGARRDEARDSRDEAAESTGDDRYRALRTTREARDAARAATTALDAATTDGTDFDDRREPARGARRGLRGRPRSTRFDRVSRRRYRRRTAPGGAVPRTPGIGSPARGGSTRTESLVGRR